MGDFEKKFPASPYRKKKIACSTNVIEKNSCTAVRKKKMLQSYFIILGGFTNPNKTAIILFSSEFKQRLPHNLEIQYGGLKHMFGSLSSAEAPRGWGRWIGKKTRCAWDDGKTERRGASLLSSPFPAFPARFRLPSLQPPNCLLHGQKGKRPLRRRECSAEVTNLIILGAFYSNHQFLSADLFDKCFLLFRKVQIVYIYDGISTLWRLFVRRIRVKHNSDSQKT